MKPTNDVSPPMNVPRPNDSELKLLRALWQAPRLSARELHDAISPSTQWGYSTTRKVLDRMEEKGLVAVKIVHGLKTYAAAQPKLDTLALLIADFSRNVLDAGGSLPVAAFAHSKLITEDEIAKLERLISALERKEGRHA